MHSASKLADTKVDNKNSFPVVVNCPDESNVIWGRKMCTNSWDLEELSANLSKYFNKQIKSTIINDMEDHTTNDLCCELYHNYQPTMYSNGTINSVLAVVFLCIVDLSATWNTITIIQSFQTFPFT